MDDWEIARTGDPCHVGVSGLVCGDAHRLLVAGAAQEAGVDNRARGVKFGDESVAAQVAHKAARA